MANEKRQPDFTGYATVYNVECADKRVIGSGAFAHQDQEKVALVWRHQHDDNSAVLGHALLTSKPDGMSVAGYFNGTQRGVDAKEQVRHGDLTGLSIYANKLVQDGPVVKHGYIREVSLVFAGANPQASIQDVVITHEDGQYVEDGSAIILTDRELDFVEHEDTPDKKDQSDMTIADFLLTLSDEKQDLFDAMVAHAAVGDDALEIGAGLHEKLEDEEGPTVGEVYATLTDEEKKVLHHLMGEAASLAGEDDSVSESDELAQEGDTMSIFEEERDDSVVISHDAMNTVVSDFVAGADGKLSDAFLEHAGTYGIDNLEVLFPDAQSVDEGGKPVWYKRQTGWVAKVLGSARKSPFSRIKTMYADITADEARAKGYVTGAEKADEVFALFHRVTTPQTIYKKQKLDRDDILDITSFDIVAWMKSEMRLMLDEEIARAILVGDGREIADPDKIKSDNVRPIYGDADIYTHKISFAAATEPVDLVDGITESHQYYKGSGAPVLYCTTSFLNQMLLQRDTQKRRIYPTMDTLKAALRVSDIVEVEVMDGLIRDDAGTNKELLGLMVNLNDYVIGADKGGQLAFFSDFNIDFNQEKYLYETRISGALNRPKAAVQFEIEVV